MESNECKIGQTDMERWLDATLRARIDAEPRAGLEERVLARLASEPQRGRFSFWPVMSAVAAILILAVALVLFRTNKPQPNVATGSHEPVTHSTTTTDAQRPPALLAENRPKGQKHPPHVASRAVVATSAHAKHQNLPMLAAFPAPSPQTDDERLLARLAARRGSFDLAAMAKGSAPPEELLVPKLEVEPMEGTPPDKPQE